ncbi:MAG TPA: acyl carrier protein [Blastocatellia bacterium]|nr:acyl carrier protein [Blastocatellia bacterium]
MLPEPVMTFLSQAARQARADMPDRDSSLFTSGLLDSFTLVDFVAVIESECGVRVDDHDLRPENFDTISKIESFIERLGKAR